jgi:hypothetical protein
MKIKYFVYYTKGTYFILLFILACTTMLLTAQYTRLFVIDTLRLGVIRYPKGYRQIDSQMNKWRNLRLSDTFDMSSNYRYDNGIGDNFCEI